MDKITDPFVKFFIILFFLAIIVFFLFRKMPKSYLAKHYVVSMPTLGKWVQYFPCPIGLDDWIQRRKLTFHEMEKIKDAWGSDMGMVLKKKQMADRMGCDYKSLSRAVKAKLSVLGLTLEAWENCSVFPPAISKRIIEIA